jgi:hypothetical protein
VYPGERGPKSPKGWTPHVKTGLPRDKGCECPVIPLGIDGEVYHLIDASGQFRSLTAGDFSHAGMQALFAQTPNYPQWAWPRYGRAPKAEPGEKAPEPPIKSFEDDAVRQALFFACAAKGLFSPTDKLRGRGAWTLKGGQLVYHAGEELWVCEGGRIKALETGLHGEHLYPRMAPLPSPWTEKITPDNNPAGGLLDTFRKWNWKRPDIDPLLLLGWIGVAFYGGALKWRSAVCLMGDKGTGKSTLQNGLKDLFGDALFHSSDTSAAGVYQKMQHDARPVAVDELEPGADPRKVDALVTLMRASGSGAVSRRGSASGAEHGIEYQLRSAFLFSAINNPLHMAQDLSRVAMLRLKPLDLSQPMPEPIDADTCGRVILARLMHEWPRFEPTLQAYRSALATGGHDARGQDTYGTLLACAELLLGPELADVLGVRLADDAAWWTENLSADSLPEIEDALPNWRRCTQWLLTSQVEAFRNGVRTTIAKVIEDLENGQGGDSYTFDQAKRDLALTGIGLLVPGDVAPADDGWVLAVPNDHPQVRKLYRDQVWQNAGWKDALRQCPHEGVMISDKKLNRVNVGGEQMSCTLIVTGRYRKAPER